MTKAAPELFEAPADRQEPAGAPAAPPPSRKRGKAKPSPAAAPEPFEAPADRQEPAGAPAAPPPSRKRGQAKPSPAAAAGPAQAIGQEVARIEPNGVPAGPLADESAGEIAMLLRAVTDP